MSLILIPCCGKKVTGGQTTYRTSRLVDILSPSSFHSLMEARQKLAVLLKHNPGPDLGSQKDNDENKYLPAFERYQGIIYTYGDVARLYPAFKGHLVIISALYGLLEGDDSIRNYNLKMDCTLPTRTRVGTFWKQHGLRAILLEYISKVGAVEVYDLLSDNYRKALRPWPDFKITNFRKYDYPGMYQGSNFARARDLKQLLSS